MIGLAPTIVSCHDSRQADRAHTENGDTCPGRDRQRVHHSAGSGLQAAAQRGQKLQRQVFVNLDEVALGGQGVGGKGRLTEEVPTDAAALQRIAAVQTCEAKVCLIEALAIRGVSLPAWTAVAAGLVGKHDRVAALDTLHAFTDLFHHARTLMTQHDRAIGFGPVVHKADIGMADA